MAGYIMNIVIPVAIIIMYEGRRILSFSNLRSTNGNATLLSTITKVMREATDIANAVSIWGKFVEFISVCISVNASRNEIIVKESARAPFKSIEEDNCFL